NAFQGLPFGQVESYGAVVRTDNLVLTGDILQSAYSANQPPYIIPEGTPAWTADYPQEFQTLLPPCAGYTYQSGDPRSEYQTGYYRSTERRQYDFQDGSAKPRGLMTAKWDALNHQTTIAYDPYRLLPVNVRDAAGLITQATYDYRVFQPALV